MSKPNHALVATVAYFGDVVEEHQVPRGRSLQIGGKSTSLAVPMPLGVDFLARCSWTHSQTVAVVDGRGRQYVLTPTTASASRSARFGSSSPWRLSTAFAERLRSTW